MSELQGNAGSRLGTITNSVNEYDYPQLYKDLTPNGAKTKLGSPIPVREKCGQRRLQTSRSLIELFPHYTILRHIFSHCRANTYAHTSEHLTQQS